MTGTPLALGPEVYERHRLQRPGEISRTERFWDIDLGILRYPSWPEPKPGFYVVARDPAGLATGVARYEHEGNRELSVGRGWAIRRVPRWKLLSPGQAVV